MSTMPSSSIGTYYAEIDIAVEHADDYSIVEWATRKNFGVSLELMEWQNTPSGWPLVRAESRELDPLLDYLAYHYDGEDPDWIKSQVMYTDAY